MLKHTFNLSLIATTIVTGIAANAYAGDGKLTLEMLYHPNERVNFNSAPLTRLSWDNQNRLIESKVNKGVAELFVVNPTTWEKTALTADGNILAILKAAKIDEKEAAKLADQLGARIKPENKAYIFTYKNDIWLLDLGANKARELTHTPEQKEDEALLSPDNKQVAYLKGNDMYVTDVATAKETRLTTGGSETVFNGRLDWVYQEEVYGRGDFRAFRWAPDSKKLAFLSFDETKVPVYTLSGDHAQPVKTDRTRYPKAGDPNPITKLGVVDLKGKVTWTHDPYPGKETLIVQVDWTPDGRLMASWQDRVQTWLDLRIYDAKYMSQAVVKETSPAWTERLPLPHFLKDGGFLWESSRTGHHHIYRYNKDFQLVNAITQGDWDVRAVHGVDEAKGRVLFAANERNPIGNDEYSIKLDGSEMKRLTEEKGTHMVRWNKTFTHFLDTWSSMTQTPKQALFTDAGAQVKLVDDHGLPAKYKELQLATMKHQQVKSRNGFLMESVLFLPPNFDATKKYPVYQHLYAGPMAPQVRDQWSTNLYYHFLAQQGYIVWVMDNQSASNKGVSSAWPIHKKLGQLELQDQLDGLDWLRQQGFADMDRIALNGWSYGGYFTSYAMTHTKAWKVGFVGAPVTDWRLYDSIYTERYMGLPKDNQEGYDKGSSLKAAKNLSGKILIMHGTMDDNVHPQNTIMFIDELAKGNKEYSLQLYPAQGHGVVDPWLNWSLQKAKWKFLQENL
ncbi:DPP IV N-terminal domain-containing protein [Undibacterium cyanobacteriorum]|uniref:DPP IV N-terminal domain-containing protein n=1 Tax=Undibacterium cyanobacteriorum TaxID=3073561 RepID=A0ABY9RL42_9BURK|nr:DPP IV N-terminal domain-containing protein [Undibacterium sp. 20NA77.5]WMW81917.1 DPP IV N-terminal domain-containing protein [Undibacterium sp. 20NA77.5]